MPIGLVKRFNPVFICKKSSISRFAINANNLPGLWIAVICLLTCGCNFEAHLVVNKDGSVDYKIISLINPKQFSPQLQNAIKQNSRIMDTLVPKRVMDFQSSAIVDGYDCHITHENEGIVRFVLNRHHEQVSGLETDPVVILKSDAIRTDGPREKGRRINDSSNLKTIGLALLTWSAKHNGNFPESLWSLTEHGYLRNSHVFISPDSGTVAFSTKEECDSGIHCDYIYVGNGLRDDIDNTTETVLAFTRPGIRPGWVNFLFADGHVTGFAVDDSGAGCRRIAEEKRLVVNWPSNLEDLIAVAPGPNESMTDSSIEVAEVDGRTKITFDFMPDLYSFSAATKAVQELEAMKLATNVLGAVSNDNAQRDRPPPTFTYKITLPQPAKSNNADEMTDEGRTLVWHLLSDAQKRIQCEAFLD